jgi:hypothetical protein
MNNPETQETLDIERRQTKKRQRENKENKKTTASQLNRCISTRRTLIIQVSVALSY